MGGPASSLYTVRSPDGLELGPIRADTVLDLIRAKKVSGNETISCNGGPFRPILEIEEFVPAIRAATSVNVKSVSTDLGDLDLGDGGGAEDDTEDEVELDLIEAEEVEELEEASAGEESFSIDIEEEAAPPKPAPPAEIELEEISEIEELETVELEVVDAAPAASAAQVTAELTNPNNRYTIRDPDGLVLGPVRVATIRDLMDAGKVTRAYQIKKNNADWLPLPQVPEIVYLLQQMEKKAAKKK